jgi:4-amino-4-deoxy-L-arabinose transferase-like glycosyltransferase
VSTSNAASSPASSPASSNASSPAASSTSTAGAAPGGWTVDDRWSLLFVLGVAAGVILPLLGAVGFFDPWETNYAEVAREMVVRDDYLYPFWKDAYFFSKPVLLFWLTAPFYALVGADTVGTPMSGAVELLGRLPSALIGIATVVTTFSVARRFWSRRAATLAAIALATMPLWAFVARQAITDLPYVGLASIALLLLAPVLFDDDDERARLQQRPLSAGLLFAIALCLLPQLWEVARTGAFLDRVTWLGSERATRIGCSVVLVGAGVAFVGFLGRRARDPLFHAACLLFALSTLAKGPVGVVLGAGVVVVTLLGVHGVPGLVVFVLYPALASGLALFLAVAGPWPVVMFAFDGLDDSRKTWFGRFVMYDLLGRVGAGVHGDRGGVEYYVRTAGLGLLPWSGFVPLALFDAVSALRVRREDKAWRFTFFVVAWGLVVFLFFSLTTTKFHHYILPFCVPAALAVGRFLDVVAEQRQGRVVVVAVAAALSALFLRDLCTAPWAWIDLFTYHYKGYKPEYYFPLDVVDAVTLPWRGADKDESVVSLFALGPAVVGGAALVGLLLATAFLRPVVAARATPLSTILGVREAPGRGVVIGAVVGAVVVAVFAVQVFWARASQHWSQRWIFATLQEERRGDEPIVAFQMDWKGETFYSKNTEIQIKKNASDLRTAVQRPGREFVLVQTDRLDNLKSALGRTWEHRLRVLDRSNAKWLLVVVD